MGYQALLFCPDEKTAHVVEKILSELDFAVAPCSEPFAAVKRITTEHFDALVVDCNSEQNAALLFKSARNSGSNHNSLAVALVEGQAGIAKAFRIGANLVLSKPINVEQSKATLRVARGLLRKAEAAKPAAAPSPEPLAPSATSDPDPLPPFIPAPEIADQSSALSPPKTVLPTAPAVTAGLEIEVEDEPVPALGAAEAALLESMPDPLPPQPAVSSGAVSSGVSQAHSWQPVSTPLLDPAPTQGAAEPTLKTGSGSDRAFSQSLAAQTSPAEPAEVQANESRGPTGSLSFNSAAGTSAAAATAPAKEIPGAVMGLYETKSAPASSPATTATVPKKASNSKLPVKSPRLAGGAAKLQLDVQDHDQEAPVEGASKKNFLIAAVLVLGLAAAGYFAWPRLQPAVMSLGIVRKYLAPQPAPVPASTPAPAPTSPIPVPASDSSAASPGTNSQEPPTTSATSAPQPQAAPVETSQASTQQPGPSTVASAASNPSGQTAAAEALPRVPASHPPTSARVPIPVVVKSDVKKDVQNRQAAPPAPLEVTSSSTDQTMAGIVSAAPAIMAKPGLQIIRVSQGVSNGLLIKRVQPIYPPLAMQMRVEGAVELEATVSKDGSTSNIKVLKGDPMLTQAAVDAVRRWKYKPYFLDGQPVELQTQITINFKLPL